MDPERYTKVGDLYHELLEVPSESRTAFLDATCLGDPDLRPEIESLLEAHERAGPFMSAPAMELAAEWIAEERSTALTGRTLRRYRLEEELGAGGMASGGIGLAGRRARVAPFGGAQSRADARLAR